ncbi:UDP-glucose--hexose-1-phosphate uridylyltransferase [Caloranaerobacter azorensis]|uniref:Galactose-1-phosphate uridylyltransferase n=1 Tax=Caloranaerobacter azorensis TaxID=116090 RepID=A0A6P1YE90_9FIRM|nr:UDP-glucose--hexose-1-phosphate uridylyltransferase [Caloranaerobacter azorensis]QIB27541.1 UDP-glucose--hexose-1-phosphate uridylyltransferase [Caloranaerobacter azorensis]
MDINREIKRLINYGIYKGLLYKEDEIYVRNRILEILKLDEYEDVEIEKEELENPQPILDNILDYAYERGILEHNTVIYRDLFDTKIMDCLIARPSDVIRKFYEQYRESPELATANYYNMSKASNYIRMHRVNKNLRWKTNTDFGELEITINLSKPEKNPIAIAKAKDMKSTSYPKCLLCKENEGYSGRIDYPARQNHRIIPIKLCDEEWFLQFSPYVYYNEHAIIFKGSHEPMKITKTTFERLLEFVEKFPHYFIGSNADLPIVGGSILSHDHFQGGNYKFAMEKAPILKEFSIKGFEDVEVGIVKWPLSVIRIRSKRKDRLTELGGIILDVWREYSDESINIISHTNDEPHNTITPIARYKNNKFELDLVLRNNRTSEEHPFGIFHPHRDVHHIKKENIGLIEVMGLAVLPARLKHELELIKECLLGTRNINEYKELEKHREWFDYLKYKYQSIDVNFDEILKFEVGKIFERILIDAGVFKQDNRGLEAFERFIDCLSR